ncbi:hypothetical protein [Aliiglaciecola litoralis]|uniref:Uncharacterized protein n=1 Tax=Aliiglaciecola litoralis TaxID=582857 RepID=A0ABP3X3T8_9ALTE
MRLNFQYSNHSHDESEVKSIKDPSQALVYFDQFDWAREAEMANEIQKCSPTLSLIIKEGEEYIWVSAYGDENKLSFVSECHFPGEVSSWFGLSKKLGLVELQAQSFNKQNARTALECFIEKKYDVLKGLYA